MLHNLFLTLIFFSIMNLGVTSYARIEVHGHRGARARFPENTLPAFQYALESGVDVLEMDMGVTKDNVIVISHEININQNLCLDENGKRFEKGPFIYHLTLQQVKTYDCGSIKNPKFKDQQTVPGTKIPTLEEVFDLVEKSPLESAKEVKFNIETKMGYKDETADAATFAKLVYETVKKRNMVSRVIIQSFDYDTLKEIRKLDPNIVISALSERPLENLVGTARVLKANFISPDQKLLSPSIVRDLHNIGVKAAPWTVNTEKDWKKLIDMNTDAIITDDPKRLIDYLNKQPSSQAGI